MQPRRFVPALAAGVLAAGGASFALGAGTASAVAVTAAPPCTASQVSWTPSLPNSPFTTTVTLRAPGDGGAYPTCSISLNSYNAAGPTWQTGDPQTFVGHVDATLSADTTSAVLTVPAPECYGQTDLYGGTTRYDGTDGALPNYTNNVVTPDNLLDHWNGGTACGSTPPPSTSTVTPTGPTVTDGSCDGTSQVPGSITGPAGIVVTDAHGVVPAGSLPAGDYTVTLDAPANTVFLAGSGYTLNVTDTIATWSVTIHPGNCTPTPQTPRNFTVPAPTFSATGTLAESCPTEASNETFTVSLTNTGNTNLTFTTTVAGSPVDSGAGFAPNSVYTFTGTLPDQTPSSAVSATFTTIGGATTVVPLGITSGADAFPCVLGETITKLAAPGPVVAPPVAVEPVTLAKPPAATLPFTGVPEMGIAVVGISLIGGGAALVLTTRRRKADPLA
jgi:hypothetical protein